MISFKLTPPWQEIHTNKTRRVRITYQWSTFVQPLLQWTSNTHYIVWVCVHLWPDRFYNISPHCLTNGMVVQGGGGEEEFLNIKCVIWFSLQRLSETFFILRKTEQDMIKNVNWSSCKVPVILVRIFSTNFRNILKYKILWKSVQWETICSMQTDGRIHMSKLTVVFRNFNNASKKWRYFDERCAWQISTKWEHRQAQV